MIFNKTKETHLGHFRHNLTALQVAKVYVNLKKCSFMENHVLFLGFISAQGVSIDIEKIRVIKIA